MVDDLIGVTGAGHQAHELNGLINIKSAIKGLQFNADKCKTMLVGKTIEDYQNNQLVVDKWDKTYRKQEHENILTECYEGKVAMEQVKHHKYLGQSISHTNDNKAHIKTIQNKAIGTKRKLFNILESLKLGRYYFECAVILFRCLLRSSILYSAETFFNVTEKELRDIEKIEEDFLRNLADTKLGCPISQLYLEFGIYPARFEIMKKTIMFYYYIINQQENSLIYQILKAQIDSPVKGDWVTSVHKYIEYLEVGLPYIDLGKIGKKKLNTILNSNINRKALIYLLEMRKSKGKEIEYHTIEMAPYLKPNDHGLTISEKKELFSLRNRMINIPWNFKQKVIIQQII